VPRKLHLREINLLHKPQKRRKNSKTYNAVGQGACFHCKSRQVFTNKKITLTVQAKISFCQPKNPSPNLTQKLPKSYTCLNRFSSICQRRSKTADVRNILSAAWRLTMDSLALEDGP
jgi:hypothetical protein